jgi:c-di-GMP-binding flagellar brake protein YcgR
MASLTEENLDSYTLNFRREIVFYLRELIAEGNQVSVIFNEGRDTIITILLDVDEAQGTLILDCGSNEESNQRFLASERNFFIALPHGIRNQFLAGKPWQVNYKKRPAFAVRLPDKYVRLQRRDFFRLTLPLTQRPKFSLKLSNGLTLEVTVIDISIRGMALEVAATNLPCTAGEKFDEAEIELKNFGGLKLEFEVRYVDQITRGSKQITRLGCRFNHLLPAQEHFLQRYITHVQSEERARLGT